MRLGRGRLMWRAMRSRSRAPTTRMVAIRSALAASRWSERQTCLVLALRARALWRRIVRIFPPKKASLPPAAPSKRGARRVPTERGRAGGGRHEPMSAHTSKQMALRGAISPESTIPQSAAADCSIPLSAEPSTLRARGWSRRRAEALVVAEGALVPHGCTSAPSVSVRWVSVSATCFRRRTGV